MLYEIVDLSKYLINKFELLNVQYNCICFKDQSPCYNKQTVYNREGW